MLPKHLRFLGFLVPVLAQEADIDFGAAAASISAELADPTFVPYVVPNQKIEEFIALGDSYTAGTGCNGNDERMAGDAVRGRRSYPMQMSQDADNWAFINSGDDTLPRFSFHAYTGDKSLELITEQLKQGDYKDDKDLPRAQPFGKPQAAVLTIGGNDATLSDILNDCIYRAWRPNDCQGTLDALQTEIDNGNLREKINYAIYQVAHAGREAQGAEPRESFQVFVLEYLTFFDAAMSPECNDYTWAYWPALISEQPPLDKALREKLNDMTTKVNAVIKAAAQDLERMGVIYIEGLQDAYAGHRYCEVGATKEMTEASVWFWSPYNHFNTPSEGPGDPNAAAPADVVDPAQQLLDFVFPGQGRVMPTSETDSTPPWEWDGAEQYPDFQSLLAAVRNTSSGDEVRAQAAPFPLLRSFHPKATAYAEHARLFFAAMADNRQASASGGGGGSSGGNAGNYTERCTDWDIVDDHLLVGSCTNTDGQKVKTQEDLNLCLRYDNGALIPADNGLFQDNCNNCFFNPLDWPDHSTLWCVCRNDADPFAKDASIDLDDLMEVQDDGFVKCFGHISAPAS